jgi:hypothetical protein
MPHNFALEARVQEACAAAGVRDSALADVVERVRAGEVGDDNIAAKITEWRETKPHYFGVSGPDAVEEQIAAFGPDRSLRAQGAFVVKHGEQHSREVAARFFTTVGGKPGIVPDDLKKQIADKDPERHRTTNPWHPANCERRKDGKLYYTARALTLQANAVRAMGEAKASALAQVWSARLGDLRPGRAA